jgi:hypothetical protein
LRSCGAAIQGYIGIEARAAETFSRHELTIGSGCDAIGRTPAPHRALDAMIGRNNKSRP